MKDTNVQLKREVASLREQLAELMLNVTWPTGCYASRRDRGTQFFHVQSCIAAGSLRMLC